MYHIRLTEYQLLQIIKSGHSSVDRPEMPSLSVSFRLVFSTKHHHAQPANTVLVALVRKTPMGRQQSAFGGAQFHGEPVKHKKARLNKLRQKRRQPIKSRRGKAYFYVAKCVCIGKRKIYVEVKRFSVDRSRQTNSDSRLAHKRTPK